MDPVMHEPNNNPIHKEFVMQYPIIHEIMSNIDPKHLSAPVKRKNNSVNVIRPPII